MTAKTSKKPKPNTSAKTPPPPDMRRRWFLWVCGGAILGGLGDKLTEAVSSLIIEGGKGVFEKVGREVQAAFNGPIPSDLARILLPHSRSLKCEIGDIHPKVIGAHPDNLFTGAAILQALGLSTTEGKTLANRQGTILAIGSPTSDSIAREIFGIGESSSWPLPNPWSLPFLYDHHDTTQPELVRWLSGSEHRSRRRGLLDASKAHSQLVKIDASDNRQLDDYLLVTVLPNYHDENSALSKGKIWHIGGVHGCGTRAFLNIFQDATSANEFAEKVNSTDYFQALFYVPEIKHDDSVRESYPVGVPQMLEFRELDSQSYLSKAVLQARGAI